LTISKNRKIEIENPKTSATYRQKTGGFNDKKELELFLVEEPKSEYKTELNLENKRGDRLTRVLQNGSLSAKFNDSNSIEH
jgi:site-specific DNA-methyltransferase (adenine-specific)